MGASHLTTNGERSPTYLLVYRSGIHFSPKSCLRAIGAWGWHRPSSDRCHSPVQGGRREWKVLLGVPVLPSRDRNERPERVLRSSWGTVGRGTPRVGVDLAKTGPSSSRLRLPFVLTSRKLSDPLCRIEAGGAKSLYEWKGSLTHVSLSTVPRGSDNNASPRGVLLQRCRRKDNIDHEVYTFI